MQDEIIVWARAGMGEGKNRVTYCDNEKDRNIIKDRVMIHELDIRFFEEFFLYYCKTCYGPSPTVRKFVVLVIHYSASSPAD